ncbi:tripartite tricarboxylate transporter substrate binding protein [Candidimonas humi]|nr:tripartite tricarboxylate transporter substrate binding protein [Candidimonas humi]
MESRGNLRRRLLKLCGGISLVAGATALAAPAQAAWPDHPIRWLVPYTAGGGSDVSTRLVAQLVSKDLGASIVVENKPGAATIIAAQELRRSAPDGYTVMTAGQGTLVLNPSLYPKLAYNANKDFAPVTALVRLPMVLVVRPNLPVKNLAELVAYIQKNPHKLSFGSVGNGSPHHLAAELFLATIKGEETHVPYKGTPQALQDIIGGQVDFMMADLSASAPLIRSGKLRALAIPLAERSSAIPDVPTFSEAGMPGFTAYTWQGVVLPAGTPKDIVDKLSAAINKALANPDVAKKLNAMGMQPMGDTPDQFRKFIGEEQQKWGGVIRERHITLQ